MSAMKVSVSKFQKKLNSFLESEVTHKSDFVSYITLLNDLTKCLGHDNGFTDYAAVVKSWIIGFETIFSENKIKQNGQTFWETYMSKFCSSITEIFFTLLPHFRQSDPHYIQEFYLRWKTILSRMNGQKRAESFDNHIDKFKIVIQNLRMATSRTEQFAILAVLRLYMERVPIQDIYRLQQHDNSEIVGKMAAFLQNPTILNQHAFLHDINALGHCIESLKPQKIICKKLKIDIDDTNYEMWLDFNKTEKTISFATVFVADCRVQSYGIASRVKLRQSVHDDHLLEINGVWNVISKDNNGRNSERATVKFLFLDKTEQLISNAIKIAFRFANSDGATTVSAAQVTDFTEQGYISNERQASLERAPHLSNETSVVPAKLTPFKRKLSQPAPPKLLRDVNRLNSSLPLFRRNGNEDDKDAEPSSKLNSTYVVKSVKTNTTSTGRSQSDNPNATYVLPESVIPIAVVQPENDRESQNDNMDVERQPIELVKNENANQTLNRTYTIGNGAPSDRLAVGAGSRVLHRDDMLFDMKGEFNESESANRESRCDETFSRKKIEIIENITIVPPAVQRESVDPEPFFPWKSNEKYIHLSQEEEKRFSANRREAHTQYSQPATSREWFYVKVSSVDFRSIGIVESNESVQRRQQRRTEVAPADFDQRDETHNQSNRTVNRDDSVPNVINEPRGRAVSQPFPIDVSSQYESFVPNATSTQIRRASQNSTSSQAARGSQSFQRSFYQNSMTLIGSSQVKAGSLKVNESSLGGTKELPHRETAETSRKKSSQNLSQKEISTKRTKCIAIADLPEMSQSHVGPANKSPKEPKSSPATRKFRLAQNSSKKSTSSSFQQDIGASINDQDSKSSQNASVATQKFKSTQNSSKKSLSSSFQQQNKVPKIDQDSKNLSLPNKRPHSQIHSDSVPPREEMCKKLKPTLNPPSTANSPQKRAATLHQQPIESVPIDDMETSPKSKQNLSDSQGFDDDFMMSHDVASDESQNRTTNFEPQAKPTAAKFFHEKTVSSNSPKMSTKIDEKSSKVKTLTNSTRDLMYRNILRKMTTATPDPPLKDESKFVPRYSSLNHAKPSMNEQSSQSRKDTSFEKADALDPYALPTDEDSSNGKTLKSDHVVCYQSNELAADRSKKNTSKDDNVRTDGIRVDEQGTVYDDKGCVFADSDELQRTALFYIENDGLNYLKKETVAALPAKKREKYERKLRTIQRMIDRGLEELHGRDTHKVTDVDPYTVTVTETSSPGGKRKRTTRKVSVTLSEKTIVDSGKRVTITRRTSKLKFSKSTKSKSVSKSKKLFGKAKPYPSSVGQGRIESLSNGTASNPSNGPVDVESPSSFFGHDQLPDDISSICPAGRSLPDASKKMIETRGETLVSQLKGNSPPLPRRDSSPAAMINDCKADREVMCANNVKELLDRLNRIQMEAGHTIQGLCEKNRVTLEAFIDGFNHYRSHQDHSVADWQQLFNWFLESMESMCNAMFDQLRLHQGASKVQE